MHPVSDAPPTTTLEVKSASSPSHTQHTHTQRNVLSLSLSSTHTPTYTPVYEKISLKLTHIPWKWICPHVLASCYSIVYISTDAWYTDQWLSPITSIPKILLCLHSGTWCCSLHVQCIDSVESFPYVAKKMPRVKIGSVLCYRCFGWAMVIFAGDTVIHLMLIRPIV